MIKIEVTAEEIHAAQRCTEKRNRLWERFSGYAKALASRWTNVDKDDMIGVVFEAFASKVARIDRKNTDKFAAQIYSSMSWAARKHSFRESFGPAHSDATAPMIVKIRENIDRNETPSIEDLSQELTEKLGPGRDGRREKAQNIIDSVRMNRSLSVDFRPGVNTAGDAVIRKEFENWFLEDRSSMTPARIAEAKEEACRRSGIASRTLDVVLCGSGCR